MEKKKTRKKKSRRIKKKKNQALSFFSLSLLSSISLARACVDALPACQDAVCHQCWRQSDQRAGPDGAGRGVQAPTECGGAIPGRRRRRRRRHRCARRSVSPWSREVFRSDLADIAEDAGAYWLRCESQNACRGRVYERNSRRNTKHNDGHWFFFFFIVSLCFAVTSSSSLLFLLTFYLDFSTINQ